MPSLSHRLRPKPYPVDIEASRRYGVGSMWFNGQAHPIGGNPNTSMPGSPREHVEGFEDMVQKVHRANGVVAGAVYARQLVMSQLWFTWRNRVNGNMFGTGALAPLQRPDMPRLMMLLEHDVAYNGNGYLRLLEDGRIVRIRPDWVDIVLGSNETPDKAGVAADAEVVAYIYWPGGRHDLDTRPVMLHPSIVFHHAPEPMGDRQYLGEAWVTAVLREILLDGQATDHIGKFFDNAATANMVVKAPDSVADTDQFKEWVDNIDGAHTGLANAWRNFYVSAGTDVEVVGTKLNDLAMEALQGGFETRVAVRSRVPATILGIREGNKGSALNQSTYALSRRQWADGWFTPYAGNLSRGMIHLVKGPRPGGADLTFDPSRIMLLQEDEEDAVTIAGKRASTLEILLRSGFKPDAAIAAATTGDFKELVGQHTGLLSVQLTPPDDGTSSADDRSLSTPAPKELTQ